MSEVALQASELGLGFLKILRMTLIKEVYVVMLVLLWGCSWQAAASVDNLMNSDISSLPLASVSAGVTHQNVKHNASCSSENRTDCSVLYAFNSYKDDGYYADEYRERQRYRQHRYKKQQHQNGYYGNMAQYDLFKEGVVYAFQNIDLVVFFVALGYCWLYMSTGSIVMGVVLFGIGVFLGNRYVETSMIYNPDILKALLLFSAGLIMLTTNELNEKLVPLISAPIGIVCSLSFRINGPADFLGQDFVNGAVIGILLIVLLANAIWSAFKDSWYVNVGRKTLGSFLLVAGVIVMGVGINPPPL